MYKWTGRLVRASRNRAFYGTLLFSFILPVCRAVLVNRTIDSNSGDPVTNFLPIYQPQSSWQDQTCSSCLPVQPDVTKAFDGTWMTTTYAPGVGPRSVNNVTLRFAGVAVWVFFILASRQDSLGHTVIVNTQVNITLDGEFVGSFYSINNTVEPNMLDVIYIYNATIFSKSGLANTSHELVIGVNDYSYPYVSYIIFDWAIYTADVNAPAPQSASASAFSSTAHSSPIASTSATSSPTPTPQRSSSNIGIIVGSTLGGLAAIALILVFLTRHLGRAPPVRSEKVEGILDIDVPPRLQPFYEREIPVPDHEPTQSKAARLREARRRELDERIQSAQHELDNLRSIRNARSAGEISDPPATGSSQPSPELALLRNEMQQLRNRMDYLQAQRESDWALGLSNEAVPPAYTQQSNNVQ